MCYTKRQQSQTVLALSGSRPVAHGGVTQQADGTAPWHSSHPLALSACHYVIMCLPFYRRMNVIQSDEAFHFRHATSRGNNPKQCLHLVCGSCPVAHGGVIQQADGTALWQFLHFLPCLPCLPTARHPRMAVGKNTIHDD